MPSGTVGVACGSKAGTGLLARVGRVCRAKPVWDTVPHLGIGVGKREPQQTGETEDTSFEALLRRVAHASGPRPAGASSLRIHPGAQLLEGRLQILRRIGEGGMGVVYEARDAHRAENVALKTLSRLAPEEIYRLKNEFRALVDLSHPHL